MLNAQLRLNHIRKSIEQGNQTISILTDISYTFQQNTTYALRGVSGSGKSTLLSIIAGFSKPTYGTVYFNNHSLAEMSQAEYEHYLHTAIGVIFQNAYLIPELSVVENVLIKSILTNEKDTYLPRAMELLERVGLAQRAHERPYVLSGGEQQRVALVRALLKKPYFLIADEPTSHLDQATGSTIIDLLLEFHQQENIGLILTTHDNQLAERMDQCLSLESGSLCLVR